MDFVEWCDTLLQAIIKAEKNSLAVRRHGASHANAFRSLHGESCFQWMAGWPDGTDEKLKAAVFIAYLNLEDIDAFDASFLGHYKKSSPLGQQHAKDQIPLWEKICAIPLDEDQERLLRIVNRLSPQAARDYVTLKWIKREKLVGEWSADEELLSAVATELSKLGLMINQGTSGANMALRSTYSGLVWEHRRKFTLESKFIDSLVAEWETTSVDFKRELYLDTASRKAEFIKDVIGLANTQASGRRWMIVGFDDKTRAYHGPPNTGITQNIIEQILATYTAPNLDVRYEVVDYRAGQIGKLEVLRNAKKLPYRVAKSLGEKTAGDKKRVEAGQIFVRHGSQTEQPTADELLALKEEGERARSSGA